MSRYKYRKIKDYLFRATACTATLFCLAILCVFLLSVSKSALNVLLTTKILTDITYGKYISDSIIPNKNNDGWATLEREFVATNPKLIQSFKKDGLIKTQFNTEYFVNGARSSPSESGIFAAVYGSAFVLILFLATTVPLGIITGVCLSEFVRNKTILALMRINIQNLTSIPGIIYGLITLSFFINYLGLPRSSIIVGSITISLLILPLMITLTYNAISSVQNEYRMAGFAMGASKIQVAFRVILPLAFSRIITSTLLSIARAAGETAPLIVIGMAFFAATPPQGIYSPATTLPLQIYLWILNPQKAFIENAEFAIFSFILFIVAINAIAYSLKGKKYNL